MTMHTRPLPSRVRRTATLSALLAVVLSAVVGCGSTIQVSGTAAVPGGLDSGLGVPDGSTPLTPLQPTGTTAVASGGSGTTPSGSGTGADPLQPGGAGIGAPGAVAKPGAPVRLGVVQGDASALLAAFGAQGPSDPFAPAKRLIAYLNGHGGIAGRRIEPVYVLVDATNPDGASEAQRACAALTQDHHVDLVLAGGMLSDVFLSCLQQKGISSFDTTPWLWDRVQLALHPNLYAIDALSEERYAAALVNVSIDRGVLKRGDTLGVLTEDCPWGPRVYNNTVVPLAKSHGVKTEMATFRCAQSLSGTAVAQATTDAQSAVLKFRSAGVTHVIVLTAAEGFIVVQFQNNAGGQQYHPKYLITSNAFPYNNGRRDGAVMFASDAVANMSGIGFKPYIDIGEYAKPAGTPQAAAQAACRRMDPQMGLAASTTDKTHWQQVDAFYSLCDSLLALRSVLELNGLRFGLSDVRRGFMQVLGTFVGAGNAGGPYDPISNRPDGIGQVQPFSWSTSENRFVYTGKRFGL
jgi:hypothetical protein